MGPSGTIYSAEEAEKLKKEQQKELIPVSKTMMEKVQSMNRAERRRYYKEYRKSEGLTWNQLKKEPANEDQAS